jgi:hypothetical protein
MRCGSLGARCTGCLNDDVRSEKVDSQSGPRRGTSRWHVRWSEAQVCVAEWMTTQVAL